MRAEFEAWFESLNYYRPDLTFGSQEHWYSDPKVQEAWSIWQASRAAMTVELPKIDISLSTGMSDSWCEGVLHACGKWRDAVEAAGIPVKP